MTVTPGPSCPGASATFPLVILTRATCSPALKDTPRNEKVWSPRTDGTKNVPSEVLAAVKYWIDVVSGRATWVNTAPNPPTVAGVLVPGTKNDTSTTLPFTAVDNFCGLKAANNEG